MKVSIFSDILLDNSVVFLFGIFLLVHASCLTVLVKRVRYGMFLTSKSDKYLISDYNITIKSNKNNENTGNDPQLKTLLIVIQILFACTIEKL